MSGKKPVRQPVSLYFHIPFCRRKCDYCHFYVLPDKGIYKDQLLTALKMQWQQWVEKLSGKEVVSIYFGGGTPSLFGAERADTVLQWIFSEKSFVCSPDIEISIEANPEDISFDSMRAYRQVGINRLSIGVQSFDDTLLAKLTRQHDAGKAKAAVFTAKEAGFDNISIDLMYDLPGQTLDCWHKTLSEVRDLPISHLSLYNLTIEPHTAFFKYKDSLSKHIPDENVSLEMYEGAVAALERYGLLAYEISAFAKDDKYSRHNIGYWTGRPFLGFGPSAFSYYDGTRFRNIANLSKYCQALEKRLSPLDFTEELDAEATRRELLAIALRLRKGVSMSSFQEKYGLFSEETNETIGKLQAQDLLSCIGQDHLALTSKGILFYDTVATEIV